jgi:hypothetical protein
MAELATHRMASHAREVFFRVSSDPGWPRGRSTEAQPFACGSFATNPSRSCVAPRSFMGGFEESRRTVYTNCPRDNKNQPALEGLCTATANGSRQCDCCQSRRFESVIWGGTNAAHRSWSYTFEQSSDRCAPTEGAWKGLCVKTAQQVTKSTRPSQCTHGSRSRHRSAVG